MSKANRHAKGIHTSTLTKYSLKTLGFFNTDILSRYYFICRCTTYEWQCVSSPHRISNKWHGMCHAVLLSCRHSLHTYTDARETVGDRQNHNSLDQAVSRRHFLTRGDINNIRTTVNDRTIRRHIDDSMSVTILVSELKEESFNPVLLFKGQGNQDPHYPTLPADAFGLAIQTQFPVELYQLYVTTVLCNDSMHGTNQYRFKLMTCIVPDDHGIGEYTTQL